MPVGLGIYSFGLVVGLATGAVVVVGAWGATVVVGDDPSVGWVDGVDGDGELVISEGSDPAPPAVVTGVVAGAVMVAGSEVGVGVAAAADAPTGEVLLLSDDPPVVSEEALAPDAGGVGVEPEVDGLDVAVAVAVAWSVVDCDDEPLEPVLEPVLTVAALAIGPLGIMAVVALRPSEPEMSRLTAVQRSAALPAAGLVPTT
jgi:hypothetical protein